MSYRKLYTRPFAVHPDDNDSVDEGTGYSLLQKRFVWSGSSIVVYMMHVTLLCCNIILYIGFVSTEDVVNCLSRDSFNAEPELDAIGYEWNTWNLTLGYTTPYTASIGRDVDDLWDTITANPRSKVDGLLVPQEQLDRIKRKSIVYPNGESLGLMDVFHQLHCLNYLRKAIYEQTYRNELESGDLFKAHTAHCIDSIRLSLQCSADTSLITFDWIADYPIPWPNFSSTHRCRNWDKLLKWSHKKYEKMTVVSNQGEGVRHPVLGLQTDNTPFKVPLREEDVHRLDDKGHPL